MADECTGIAADDSNNKVHAASFALTAHDAVGNVANKNASQYRPSREFYKVF